MLGVACAASPDPARISEPDPGQGGAPGEQPPGETPLGDGGVAQSNGDPLDPFEAGVAYAADLVSLEATRPHAEAGAPAPRSNADCLACHGAGNAGATTKFAVGGITFTSAAADGGLGAPCASCELLFVDSVGHRVKVKTAADGTFALSAADYGAVSPGTHVGIRKGGAQALMTLGVALEESGALRGCNTSTCHAPNATENPIVLGAN